MIPSFPVSLPAIGYEASGKKWFINVHDKQYPAGHTDYTPDFLDLRETPGGKVKYRAPYETLQEWLVKIAPVTSEINPAPSAA